jgi:hypothetical protein
VKPEARLADGRYQTIGQRIGARRGFHARQVHQTPATTSSEADRSIPCNMSARSCCSASAALAASEAVSESV